MRPVRDFVLNGLARIGVAHWLLRYLEWRRSRTDDAAPAVDKDGAPMPPPYLMYLVGATTDWRFFLKNGREAVQAFAALIDAHGGDFRGARRILDFGCGCGRLARHLPKLTQADIYGVDYNRRLINWCAANLPGDYRQNALTPPLSFDADFFDIIYLYSVFTHLRIETQRQWLDEFARVIRPGGFALVTFHDEDHPGLKDAGVSPDRLAAEKVFIRNRFSEGSNFIATFQSRDFARQLFGEVFDVCEIVPSNETPAGQAIAVLRRRVSRAPSLA